MPSQMPFKASAVTISYQWFMVPHSPEPPVFVNEVYWNTAMSIRLHIIYGSVCIGIAELSSCDHVVLYRKVCSRELPFAELQLPHLKLCSPQLMCD